MRTAAEHTDVVLAPPFVDLRSVASVVESERIPVAVGAQHVNPHEHGAHTGEVSVAMLAAPGRDLGDRRATPSAARSTP